MRQNNALLVSLNAYPYFYQNLQRVSAELDSITKKFNDAAVSADTPITALELANAEIGVVLSLICTLLETSGRSPFEWEIELREFPSSLSLSFLNTFPVEIPNLIFCSRFCAYVTNIKNYSLFFYKYKKV